MKPEDVQALFDSSNDPILTIREVATSQTPKLEHPDPEGGAFVARMPGDEPHPYEDPNPYLNVLLSKLRVQLIEKLGTEDERLIRRAMAVQQRPEDGGRP